MRHLTTQRHYEVPGGTLKVILTTDHALSTSERVEFDRIDDACEAFRDHVARLLHPAAVAGEDPGREVDDAIWALGGDADIMAG
jgi:hypothetical protein